MCRELFRDINFIVKLFTEEVVFTEILLAARYFDEKMNIFNFCTYCIMMTQYYDTFATYLFLNVCI